MGIYFETYNKMDCNGCGVCALKCTKGAITMQSDSEGFLYPVIDKKKCINEKASESFKKILKENKYKNMTLGKIIKINKEYISSQDLNIYHNCRKKIYLTYKKKLIKIQRP